MSFFAEKSNLSPLVYKLFTIPVFPPRPLHTLIYLFHQNLTGFFAKFVNFLYQIKSLSALFQYFFYYPHVFCILQGIPEFFQKIKKTGAFTAFPFI